jgi:hypothetical protein
VSGERARVLGTAALVAAAASACAKVGNEPGGVVSLGFDTSSVAVVVGDTLRDTLGRLLPLRAAAFGATNDTIQPPAVQIAYSIAPTDTGALRLAGDLAIGVRPRATAVRVFASAGGLQSLAKSVDVIRLPRRLTALALADSAGYVNGVQRSAVSVGGAQLRVEADSGTTAVPVRRVVVRFAFERAAPRVADSVALIDERTPTLTLVPRSPLDTADNTGAVGRRALVFLREGATGRDTLVLRATLAYPAAYQGSTAARDTVRILVPVIGRAATP